jgi:hypothetical protein
MALVTDMKTTPKKRPAERIKRWLLAEVVEDVPGPQAKRVEVSSTPGGRSCA